MNKTIMITGANAGIGKDTARQLALINTTEKIYLACRNKTKATLAKQELEQQTKRTIFEIIIMDVADPTSVRKAVKNLNTSIDALIMNAGGIGGKTPGTKTKDGVTVMTATNLLGHAVLVDELLKDNKLNNIALYASSEAARGIKQTGMPRPDLTNSSVNEFTQVLDGSWFGNNFDPMKAYGFVKYAGTLWMSAMARKHPHIKFISMSPGGTRGTQGFDDLPLLKRIFFKHIGMPLIMPMMGLSHSLEKGAQRFVDGVQNPAYKSGVFYASKEKVLTGQVIDQSSIFSDLKNMQIQENAYKAVQQFM